MLSKCVGIETLQLKYMEEAARSITSGRVLCPYTDCGKAVLNTKRMIKIAWEVKCDKVQEKEKCMDTKKDGYSASKKRPAVDASRAENFKRIKSGKQSEKNAWLNICYERENAHSAKSKFCFYMMH